MIDFSDMEKKLNKEMMEGYRFVFLAITREIRRAAVALKKTNNNASGEEIAWNLCQGAKIEELVKLSNEMNECGEYLIKVAKEINKNIPDKNADLTGSDFNNAPLAWFDEVICFREHGYIVDRMLNEYKERLNCQMENSIKSWVYGHNYSL